MLWRSEASEAVRTGADAPTGPTDEADAAGRTLTALGTSRPIHVQTERT
jgi:hypothetical protein